MHEFAERLSGAVLSATAGDTAADLAREFEARLADCSKLAVRVAYSVLRQQQDAEDVAQEAFVRAHRCFHQLRDRDAFRAWLVRVVWRLAIDHRRSSKRRVAREQFALETGCAPSTEDAAISRQRSERLWAAIDELPDRLRIAIVLASIEEHGVKEVAALTGAPEGTVKSRLHEARKLLHEKLR